ncbi:MAG: hypothetical protein MMC23_002892 [Stictis urceolatum]|nr:hypothetical protein [Stictis urceolata]
MSSSLSISKVFDVSNMKCVVTGGGTGIGLMIAEALAANGARVYITGRRQEKLDNVASKYNDKPGKIIALPGDVSKKESLKQMADELASSEPNGIHLLVNNAGIASDDPTKYSTAGQPDMHDTNALAEFLWKSEPERWDDTFRTNVTAQYFTSIAFLPLLAKGRSLADGFSPSIVMVASISGILKGSSGGQFAYGASKAASLQLTRSLATTLLDSRIRVNCIAPGVFPSEMTTSGSDENNKSQMGRKATNPAKRFGEEGDMAACILHLASQGGSFLNGQVLYPE